MIDEHPDDQPEDEFGPDDPDYDLSEAHGYAWDAGPSRPLIPQWLIIVVVTLIVVGLLLPGFVFVAQHT